MGRQSVIDVTPVQKRRKTPAPLRKQQILALQTIGLSQGEIADKLGVSRRSISRDLEDLQESKAQMPSLLSSIQDELKDKLTPTMIAERLVELVTKAKNEAVSQGAIRDVLEYMGEITEKERLRAKTQEQSGSQAMFVLPPGASLSFTFNQQNNTVSASDTSDNDTTQSHDAIPVRDIEKE